MITKSQIDNNDEWIRRLQNTLKLYEILEKECWFEDYGKWIVKDIKERRLENIVQNKEVVKLENELINKKEIK